MIPGARSRRLRTARRPSRWSPRSRRRRCRTSSGTTTDACRPSRLPSSSSTRAGSAGSFTIALTSSRTGRSPPELLQQEGHGPLATRRGRRPASGVLRRSAGPLHRLRVFGSTAASRTSSAMTETFIKERKHQLTGKVQKVTIDDACSFMCRFDNGSLGLFESTRYALGHKGALHAFEVNRREGVAEVGPARPASARIFRSPRRRPLARLAQHSRHRRRSSLYGEVVGAGPPDRLRAHVHAPDRRFPRRTRDRQAGDARLPRRVPDPTCARRDFGLGKGRDLG